MAIIQISKIQQRSGNMVDLPQLDEAELGWATDVKKLYIGKTTPNENVEILTTYSEINFGALSGSYGNLNINPVTAEDGQVLTFDGADWVNRGGASGGLINLGDVSNVKITGGAIGYVLTTDGIGNLSWTPKGTIISFIENVAPAKLPTYQTYATNAYSSNNIIQVGNSSGYTANAPVTFTGTGFGNITSGNLYYIRNVLSSTEITITDTPGNANITLTNGTGNLTLNMVGTILTTTEVNFLTEGAEATITDAIGMTELNGNSFYIDLLTSNTIGLFLNPGLTTPLYSNNYTSYAYTPLQESFNANYTIEVGNSAQFTVNDPVRFVGDLGNSDLSTGVTYYVNAVPSITTIRVSATTANGTPGPVYPVQDEIFASAAVYVEGGRIISAIGSSGATEASGSNTTIQFNNNNLLDGDAGLTWNFGLSPKVLSVTGNANISNDLNVSSTVIAPVLISNVATGTAPLTVTSSTRVANLNVARANVSDFSNVQAIATGTFYPVFVNDNIANNYQLYSNTLFSFYPQTGNLTANNFIANSNITSGNANLGNAVTANYFIGSLLGPLANGNSNVAIPAANGNVNISSAGNANILVVTGTGVNVTGTLNVSANANVGNIGTNTAIITTGNITTINSGLLQNGNSNLAIPVANGNVNISSAGNANILVVTGTGVNVTGTLNVSANANVGNIGTTGLIATGVSNLGPVGNVIITGGSNGQILSTNGSGNLSWITISTSSISNGNSNVSIPAANGNATISIAGNSNIVVVTGTGVNVAGTMNVSSNINGNYLIGNFNGPLLNITGDLTGNINVATVTGNLGFRVISSNYVAQVAANTAISVAAVHAIGKPTVGASNANVSTTELATLYIENAPITVGNLSTTNAWSLYIANGNSFFGSGIIFGDGSGIGNVRSISYGNSNVKVYNNANVEVSVTGNANIGTFTGTGFRVAGNIQATLGYIEANGNITANGNIFGGNANITTELRAGSLKSAVITAPSGNITISAAGTNESIYLVPTGTGTVDAGGKRITQVGSVTSPNDATNKEYVDAIAGTGLTIHSPANVALTTNLTGTYANGGTTPTTTTISGGNTITFSGAHGLSVNDGIVWTSTFNGIIGGEGYWVATVPAATQITIKNNYFGSEITTLTNGTGLSQGARANPGVGATLTNSGANAALTIDGITVSAAQRVLLVGQTANAQNGVYVVTTPGNSSTAWVLTRSSDMNKYVPGSSSGMGSGDYLFVTQGSTNAGTSWVLSSPTGEIIIGTNNISFSQFSAAGSYTAGNGINISGTLISANTDGTTTAIVGGNIVVKTSATFTTPNIGAATGTSLTVDGNVTANNISVSNLANVGGNITTSANVLANVNVVANGNISGNNFSATSTITATGNVSGGNLTTTGNVSASGNITGNNVIANSYFIRSVGTGISANGSTQATATGLSKDINVVSTVSSGQGVKLPTAIAGMVIIIRNSSANNLLVYPPSSAAINALAADAAYTQPTVSTLQYVAVSTSQWYTVGATYA